jgi:hypothetical protein
MPDNNVANQLFGSIAPPVEAAPAPSAAQQLFGDSAFSPSSMFSPEPAPAPAPAFETAPSAAEQLFGDLSQSVANQLFGDDDGDGDGDGLDNDIDEGFNDGDEVDNDGDEALDPSDHGFGPSDFDLQGSINQQANSQTEQAGPSVAEQLFGSSPENNFAEPEPGLLFMFDSAPAEEDCAGNFFRHVLSPSISKQPGTVIVNIHTVNITL